MRQDIMKEPHGFMPVHSSCPATKTRGALPSVPGHLTAVLPRTRSHSSCASLSSSSPHPHSKSVLRAVQGINTLRSCPLCSEHSMTPTTLKLKAQLLRLTFQAGLLAFSDPATHQSPRIPERSGCVAPPSFCTCWPLCTSLDSPSYRLSEMESNCERPHRLDTGAPVALIPGLRFQRWRLAEPETQHPPAQGPSARPPPSEPEGKEGDNLRKTIGRSKARTAGSPGRCHSRSSGLPLFTEVPPPHAFPSGVTSSLTLRQGDGCCELVKSKQNVRPKRKQEVPP